MICDKVYRLRVREHSAHPQYIAWMLNGEEMVQKLEAMKSGISDSGLNLKQAEFLALALPLPPLSEQRRIVARIEALFIRTGRARADLERIAPLSLAYRRGALDQTFATAADQGPTVALGSLVSAIEAGKNILCDERLPSPGENGIVKISAVTWGQFDPKAIKTAPHVAILDPRSRIANGDFLMSRANTLELVGAPVIADNVPADTYLSDKVLRLRFHEATARWILWFLRSPAGRREIEARSSGNQLSMRNIGQGALRAIPIPMPHAQYRSLAIAAIERGQECTAIIEQEAARGRALLDRLERGILERAFRGELVSQDASHDDTESPATPPTAPLNPVTVHRRKHA